ncbi:unnamed protein product [Thelazia callipaeda]|uniref:Serine/threonine-protein kinase DDB_G0282963 n=1 Tax=Thelazia callipaeda TaxID=103827 RepID=A0A0N5CQP5_THECL|nr:unnamed protein product [Thelazia callipaeda]
MEVERQSSSGDASIDGSTASLTRMQQREQECASVVESLILKLEKMSDSSTVSPDNSNSSSSTTAQHTDGEHYHSHSQQVHNHKLNFSQKEGNYVQNIQQILSLNEETSDCNNDSTKVTSNEIMTNDNSVITDDFNIYLDDKYANCDECKTNLQVIDNKVVKNNSNEEGMMGLNQQNTSIIDTKHLNHIQVLEASNAELTLQNKNDNNSKAMMTNTTDDLVDKEIFATDNIRIDSFNGNDNDNMSALRNVDQDEFRLKIKNENEKEKAEVFMDSKYISESQKVIPESFEENMCKQKQQHCLLNEHLRSTENLSTLNEIVEDKLTVSKRFSEELSIVKNKDEAVNQDEELSLDWQQNFLNESQLFRYDNSSVAEFEVSNDSEAMKDCEHSINGEMTAQMKSKFYGVITGLWKHTGFSKKRQGNCEQAAQNVSLESTDILSNDVCDKNSMLRLQSSQLFPSNSVSSCETGTDSLVKCVDSHVESSDTVLFHEDSTFDTAPSSTSTAGDNLLLNSVNDKTDISTTEVLNVLSPDCSYIPEEANKNSDDSWERSEFLKKSRKMKTESTNLFAFGHKVINYANLCYCCVELFNFITSMLDILSTLIV